MKRDMDVIRQLVLRLEDGYLNKLDGVEAPVYLYHAQLLIEAGLAEGALAAPNRGVPTAALLWRLTWLGHDFADAIRNDTIWNSAKEKVIKPSASWTFGVLLDFLKLEIRRHIPGLE
ncbi:DUF2513 domain-containing protein [Pseudomonas chengduensis]|nr:DUF2513 domain-containing protein [Pseudomonas chengduensis]MDH0958965.1 DUF2513 domain-containing protein [Pseudomonas chengduensis]